MDSRTQRASGTVVDPRASLAMWLRTGRTQKNLSLEDVARITKIQPRILEKLETGNLEGLPADVFVKGFVRSFAKCCGLDEKEAIERLGAAQSGQPITSAGTAVARAFVDSMSVRVVQATPSEPVALVTEPVAEPVIEMAPVAEVAATAAVEATPAPAPAPAIEVIEIVEVAPLAPVASVATEASGSKKKRRKDKRTGAQRARKKQSTESTIVAQALITTVVDAPASTSRMDAEQAVIEAAAIEASTLEAGAAVEVAVEDVVEDATVDSPALAAGSQRISSSHIAVEDRTSETAAAVESAQDVAGTWQPTMPPLSTAPSVPWRRPQVTQPSTYVVPHMVIDDADPESADREREHRNAREPSRLSFLPPILLDREDRSARQGGLTLAVIILLIAATLTLSYLMRRPSARGEGVTRLDGQSELLG